VQLELPARPEQPVREDPELLDPPGQPARPDKQEEPDQLEPPGQLVKPDQLEPPGQLVKPDELDQQEVPVQLVLPGRQAQRDQPEEPDPQDQPVQLELLVQPEQPASLQPEALLVSRHTGMGHNGLFQAATSLTTAVMSESEQRIPQVNSKLQQHQIPQL